MIRQPLTLSQQCELGTCLAEILVAAGKPEVEAIAIVVKLMHAQYGNQRLSDQQRKHIDITRAYVTDSIIANAPAAT